MPFSLSWAFPGRFFTLIHCAHELLDACAGPIVYIRNIAVVICRLLIVVDEDRRAAFLDARIRNFVKRAPIAKTLLLSTPRARCPRSNDKYNGSNTITSSLCLRMSWTILAITCGSPNAGASRLIHGLAPYARVWRRLL